MLWLMLLSKVVLALLWFPSFLLLSLGMGSSFLLILSLVVVMLWVLLSFLLV